MSFVLNLLGTLFELLEIEVFTIEICIAVLKVHNHIVCYGVVNARSNRPACDGLLIRKSSVESGNAIYFQCLTIAILFRILLTGWYCASSDLYM